MSNLSYKQIRQLAGYTQESLSKVCDVDRRTIARFENGLSQNAKLQEWYDERLRKMMSKPDFDWDE